VHCRSPLTAPLLPGGGAQPSVTVGPAMTLPAMPAKLTPPQVAAAYQIPAGDGAGVTVGVIALTGALNSDVFHAYCALLGITPPTITPIRVNGALPTSDGFDAEVSLDLAVLGSLTPRADIRIYYTPSTVSEEYLAAVTQAVAECDVVSSSWVNNDDNVPALIEQEFEHVLLQARARGVSYFNASGDWASDGKSPTRNATAAPSVVFPADCPSVISVGATSPTITNGLVTAETGLPFSGGGPSRVFPDVSCPVVACFGDPDQGYAVALSNATWLVMSSTSGAAPFMAAVHTRLIQEAGKRFDFLDFALAKPEAFNDITTGSAYTASTGRDYVTGLGSPNGPALLTALRSYRPGAITDENTT
jgi:kumamolisin